VLNWLTLLGSYFEGFQRGSQRTLIHIFTIFYSFFFLNNYFYDEFS
jgi:hypothetical protein